MHIEGGVGDLYGLLRYPLPLRHQSSDLARSIGPGETTYTPQLVLGNRLRGLCVGGSLSTQIGPGCTRSSMHMKRTALAVWGAGCP